MGPSTPSLFDKASLLVITPALLLGADPETDAQEEEKQGKEDGISKGTTGDFDLELCDLSHDEWPCEVRVSSEFTEG